MTGDVVDPRTGELLNYQPANPADMEWAIHEVSELIEQMPGKLRELNEARYEAERAYARKREQLLARYSVELPNITAARARANSEAMGELEAWHNAKAAWHYADDTLKALQSKLSALQSINKGVNAAYGSYGRRP